jgi:hypothetical protein
MPARLRLSWGMKTFRLFFLPVLESLEFGSQVIRYALIFASAFFRQRASLGCSIEEEGCWRLCWPGTPPGIDGKKLNSNYRAGLTWGDAAEKNGDLGSFGRSKSIDSG